jgi:hypothetical protein
MNRRSVVIAMVVGASLLASEAMYAAPVAVHAPVYAMFGAEGLVKFSLHNETDTPIKVKAGDTEMTLAPGKIVPVKLPVGAKVVVLEASTHYAEGSVLTVVYQELSNSTLALK